MRDALSIIASDAPIGDEICPRDSCLGIDVSISPGAPGDEVLRIDVRTNSGYARALDLGLSALRLGLPLVERRGELLSIDHDFEDALVIRASVPGNPGGVRGPRLLFGHEFPPSVVVRNSTVADAPAATSGRGRGCAT